MVLIINYHLNQMMINVIYKFHLMHQEMMSLIILKDLTLNLIIQYDVK